MSYAGNILLGNTIDVKFTTRNSSGVPTTLAGSPVISAYIGNSTTEITAGITLTVDFDSRTGLNNVRVVASGGNGFTTATDVTLVITTGTVNSVSVVGEVVGEFSIDNRVTDTTKWNGTAVSTPATAGIPDVNVKNIDNDAASASGTVTFPNATLASTNNITAAAGITLDYTNALPTTPVANTIGEALFLCDILGGRFGTAQAGSSTTITLDAGASATNGRYVGYMVFLYGGTGGGVRGVGQARTVVAYDGATKICTMDTAWGTNPDNTSKFMLLVHPPVNVHMWVGTQIAVPFSPGTPDVRAASLGANSITDNTIETDAISADSLKADAITEIATGVWALATRQLTSAQTFNLTGNITGNLTGTVGTVNAFAANSITAAAAATDFGTEMATAVWALGTRTLSLTQNFDNSGQWTGDIVGGMTGSINGTVGGIATGGITTLSFAPSAINAAAIASNAITAAKIATDAIGAAQLAADAVTEIQSGLSTLTAPGVRTAVGLASANLDTQLAAVQADTDNIQSRLPAALVSGRMDSSVGAMAANVLTASALATDAVTEISDAVRAGITTDHGVGSYVDTGGGGTGGLNPITIHVTDGSGDIQNARVRVYNGSILIVDETSDVSGDISSSADDGTFTLIAAADGYSNYSAPITVSGSGAFTVTMTAVAPLPAPSSPDLCTVGGYIRDGQGNLLDGVEITIQAKRPIGTKPVVENGAVVSFKKITIVTGAGAFPSGFASAEVDRTDSFGDITDVTYDIRSSGGELKSTGVTLTTPTRNFTSLP